MPRRENPLGPAEDELIRFAADLRVLREQAGTPTYRQLSARAHYSAAALSEAASGRKLPSLPVTLAYVRACDGDPAAWERRWRELAASHAKPPADPQDRPDETAPYAGFAPITDPELFAGRADLVAELVAKVREQRVTVVVGASGSGKTSLLTAGLLPALSGDHVMMTPGERPLEECAVRLADVVGMAPCDLHRELAAAPENLHLRIRQACAGHADDLVSVVDQLEDAFDSPEGDAFVAAVVHAATTVTSRVRVVLAVRADRVDALPQVARDGLVHVGPMSADGLREAITDPAAAAGSRVETALLVRLIADAGGPGTLPFLQQALLDVWRRRRGTTLTVASYDATGGVPQLVADAAERAYTSLGQDAQRLARHLLARLASDGRGLRRDDLDADAAAVLDALVRARVVVADRDRLVLAGRSLRDRWPRLRTWLAEDGDRLSVHRELAEAATTWDSLGRDPGALYRGVRLDTARSRLRDPVLTARERDFLAASLAAHTGERRRVRGLRAGLVLLSTLVVLAAGVLAYAVRAGLSAEEQRAAALAQGALREATALLDTDPALAAQLTLAAHRLAPTAASRSAVLSLFATPYATRLTGHANAVHAVAVNRDGDLLATAGEDATVLWDIGDPAQPRRLSELPIDASSVLFSDDGQVVVTSNERGAALWDVSDPAQPHQTSFAGRDPQGETPTDVALSADGRLLALSRTTDVRLYDLADGDRPRGIRSLIGHTGRVTSVAVNREGTLVATASEDHSVRLWPVAGGPPTVLTSDGAPDSTPMLAVEFSQDGTTVVAGGADGSARVWRVADGAQLSSLVVRAGPVRAVALHDGLLATAGDDRSTVLWDMTNPRRPRELVVLTGHTDSVTGVQFTPDGRHLVTSSRDRTVRVVNIAEAVTGRVPGGALAWGGDGTVMASGGTGTVLLTDVRNRYAPRAIGTVPGGPPSFAADRLATGGRLWDVTDPAGPVAGADLGDVTGSALSRDGRLLVTTYAYAAPRLWDVADPAGPRALADLPVQDARVAVIGDRHVVTLGDEVTVWDVGDLTDPTARTLPARNWRGVALRQDGKVLAAVAADGTASLFDVRTMTELGQFPAGAATALAFSPDGRTLVTATGPTPRLWDVSDPRRPTEAATLYSGDNARTITAVAFSPDSGSFATTSADGTVRIWDATVERVARRVCAVAHPRITAGQWERHLPGVPYRPPCA